MSIDRRAVVTTTLAAVGLGWPALADAPFGPKVGTRAPQVGALRDQEGKPRALASLAGSKGTVLMFFRSAGWCPYCQAQLIAMNDGVAQIEAKGYRLVGISYEPPEVSKAFTERRGITFPLLADPKSVTIDRWGLRDPQYPEGNRAFGVPRPIIFVIDRKGMIRAALAEETFRTRPPVELVVKTLDGLK